MSIHVEDNASVCAWLEKIQLEKEDSVTDGYTSELWDFTRISLTQNEFQELKDIWAQWDDETKQLFYQNYGDLPYLLDIKVDKHLFRAMIQFWNPAYSCFTFGEVDLVPTLEEYTTLLRCPRIQCNRAYVKVANLPTFVKKLMSITGMSEQWAAARIQQKGDVIFPKVMGNTDEAVADLFDRLGKQKVNVPCQVLFEDYSPLKEAAATPRRDDITKERWMEILQNLQEEDVMWKVPWMAPNEVLYRCGSFDWVPLPEIWGVVGYVPLLVLRQYKTGQFIPATQGLAQSDFLYKGDHYKKKMREISEAWKKVCCVKILTEGPTTTLECKGWFSKRINDNIPRPSLGAARSMEESLRVIPSELEVIKQEFERKNLELGKKIERLEEKMYLSLDVDVQKIELSMKRAGLGKSSEQWQQEVQEERAKAEYWKKKFQEM
ncbi:uncharacterized protein [Gossypium hirsutum]|uniref:DUF7745 domain-containing protein n=1 Tax=Gossypium hirsutum TaxID=3635 RepID=A0ABM2Z5M6_GOSHI|nr:uncharacterized protein LOC121209994 [Gossypium hirsutum]